MLNLKQALGVALVIGATGLTLPAAALPLAGVNTPCATVSLPSESNRRAGSAVPIAASGGRIIGEVPDGVALDRRSALWLARWLSSLVIQRKTRRAAGGQRVLFRPARPPQPFRARRAAAGKTHPRSRWSPY